MDVKHDFSADDTFFSSSGPLSAILEDSFEFEADTDDEDQEIKVQIHVETIDVVTHDVIEDDDAAVEQDQDRQVMFLSQTVVKTPTEGVLMALPFRDTLVSGIVLLINGLVRVTR